MDLHQTVILFFITLDLSPLRCVVVLRPGIVNRAWQTWWPLTHLSPADVYYSWVHQKWIVSLFSYEETLGLPVVNFDLSAIADSSWPLFEAAWCCDVVCKWGMFKISSRWTSNICPASNEQDRRENDTRKSSGCKLSLWKLNSDFLKSGRMRITDVQLEVSRRLNLSVSSTLQTVKRFTCCAVFHSTHMTWTDLWILAGSEAAI